jgi:hypothetical protein
MSQTSAIAINIILDGQNYCEWTFFVETTLRGYGLAFHLTDDPLDARTDNNNASEIKTWKIKDGKVMAAIVNSAKQSMIMSLSFFNTAKAMWSYLQKHYVQDSGALRHTLMQKIHLIEQNDLSIDEYYSAFDHLMGPLMSMVPQCTTDDCTTYKFIEKFFTYRFVMGLKSDFETIHTRLLHGSTTLTMIDALSDLLAEETRLQSMAGSLVPAPHNVLAASHKCGGSRGSSLEPCKHCNKNTHRSEQCFEKYPEKLAEYHSCRVAQGRGNPKGSVSVAAASSVAAPQPSWVLDSGASFHVTSDCSQLGTCMPITDGASVQTTGNTSCPVTYMGSPCNS